MSAKRTDEQRAAQALRMRGAVRERSGRYDVRDFARVCVCGHTLGQHLAERPRGCIECEASEASGAECDAFKPR
jgi:hypothetical protein